MGSKRLKAIAVRGTGAITVAKPEAFLRLIEVYLAAIAEDPVLRRMTEAGLACFRDGANQKGNNPYRNFQDMFWDPAKVAKTSSRVLRERYYVRNLGCFACPVACSHHIRLSDTVEGEGIPSNAIGDWGCKLDVDNLDAIVTSYFLCNQYGLDSDNAAGAIAWLMECQQRGLLTQRDTDGLDLTWGNHHAVHALIRKIAYREGVGNLLAEGGVRAARKLGRGSEKYVVHVKGQELHESLRGRKGYALGVVTSPRGGGHLRGAITCETGLDANEGLRFYGVATAGNRRAYKGKSELVIYFETLKAVVDALGICYFATKSVSLTLPSEVELSALLSAAFGYDVSARELLRIGERIRNVERLYNVRAGMTRQDDVPPARFFQPIPSGPYQGERLERDAWDAMLNQYYALSGWDTATGHPTKAKLDALGLVAVHLSDRD
jgi:aldehyde:ferredoxin oxidoreductase